MSVHPTQNTQNTDNLNPPSSQTLALQWNILGLRGRLPELQLLINQFNPTVIALQETLVPESQISSNFLKGYTLYVKENSDNRLKCGIALAVKSDIPHRRIELPSLPPAIAVEIDYPIKATLVSIYISPQSQKNPELKSKLNRILKKISSPVLLMGDFNGHSTLWGGSDRKSVV